jgi:hypothetical protein
MSAASPSGMYSMKRTVQPAVQREPREVRDFVVVGAAHRHAVELQSAEADRFAAVEPAHDSRQFARSA